MVERVENAGSPGFDPPILHQLGMVVQSYSPSTWEIEAGGSGTSKPALDPERF